MKFKREKNKMGEIRLILGVIFLVCFSITASAYVAGSTNYRLQSDSLNSGGELATSTNYRIEDTTGEVSTGDSSSTSYKAFAGFQQMQAVSLSVSAPTNITMTALSLTQDTSVGNSSWIVITDNSAGYSTTVYAEVSGACSDTDGQGAIDAMCDISTGESFKDVSISKHLWSVSNEYAFGWSAYGDNVTGHGTDSDCIAGTDVPSAGLLWQGFNASTAYQIASSSERTSPSGTTTTLCVATEQDTVFAPSGTYTATTTITVITL